ncbi:TPA: hypothetical protein ACPJ16_004564 [Vibrio alginolyticus]|uniref:hypothetical protein n=1 Tax=unclassified Vibrio TaxID=2614977 RepID=UPI001881A788|nr:MULTISPECIES: hypothetical protein [unclassified Vibrio]EGX6964067.1 hypothetical protein [Vibrio alginolyticus]EIC9816099.1 hypothetical protein [Vibrio alginolyticus]EJX2556510.1 hypothetical protein [Vibrio alginolyticus]ELB2282883.1 hypothetical protein [Vibrio alginolyticus]MBE8569616.1 hypothetical protein [Vibrio sp. OPT46]
MANLFASRGYGLGLIERYNASLADLNKAIALDPTKAVYFDVRAIAADHLGKSEQAYKDRETACSLEKILQIVENYSILSWFVICQNSQFATMV